VTFFLSFVSMIVICGREGGTCVEEKGICAEEHGPVW